MAVSLYKYGELRLRLGGDVVRVFYRRPAARELIETLTRKMPRGDEAKDAERILVANLDLGAACVTGIGEGDLEIDGAVLVTDEARAGYQSDWRQVVADRCPLVLIALGQYVSALPSFLEEAALKKTSGMPGESLAAG